MCDVEPVLGESRKCCTYNMRKAAELVAVMHIAISGPFLMGMVYINDNKGLTLFGDDVKGPLPVELEIILIMALVVLGLRVVGGFMLLIAENNHSPIQLRIWMLFHLFLSLVEVGVVMALATVIYEVDPEILPFVLTMAGGLLLLVLEVYALTAVLGLHTALMKRKLVRKEATRVNDEVLRRALGCQEFAGVPAIGISPSIQRRISLPGPRISETLSNTSSALTG